jgi:hypothetical protein
VQQPKTESRHNKEINWPSFAHCPRYAAALAPARGSVISVIATCSPEI